MTAGVEILDTAAEPQQQRLDCPCGWDNNLRQMERQHAARHLEWSTGVRIPTGCDWPPATTGSIVVVAGTAPMPWRRLAYQCARIAQRDGGYDFASFPYPAGRGEPGEDKLRAYLYVSDCRVAGYVSVTDQRNIARWDYQARPEPLADHEPRPSIDLVSIPVVWRRRGIASALVAAVAAHSGRDIEDLAWCSPFSEAGKALARKLSPDGVWLS